MHYDVFNGDADGIIALVQLRLAQPKESILITGVKRDISLLKQVSDLVIKEKPKDGDHKGGTDSCGETDSCGKNTIVNSVTVLDISMEKNKAALDHLLQNNVEVFYVDHHRSGDIPTSAQLTALINTDANTCTSLLVNEYLNNAYPHWAVVAAFGDNMTTSAVALADKIGLTQQQQDKLSALGIYINYNGYGRSVEDLHYDPAQLFKLLLNYSDPLELIGDENSVFFSLEQAYQSDMAKAKSAKVLANNEICKVVLLADEAWARRISGVFGNELANQSPNKAHAVLTLNSDSTYTVSVRAPLNNKQGADELCVQFPTGGGRASAAGINNLPKEMLGDFIAAVSLYYETK